MSDLTDRLRTPKVTHHQISDAGESYATTARVHPVERIKIEAADALNAQATEIAILRADAERLEWIEKRLFVRKWNGVIDGGSRIQWSIAGDFRHTTQRMVGITFRAAVDAARGTA